MRTCIGCRATRPQHELIRCALTPEGSAIVSRTAPGRGAWLCSPACLPTAKRKRAFERAWRRPFGDGALEALLITFESTSHDMRDLSAAGNAPAGSTPTKG